MCALPGAGCSLRSGRGSRLHGFGSGEHLLCAFALCGLRAICLLWVGIVDVVLLIVEEQLVLVAGALCVVEDVLAGPLALLSARSLRLSTHQVWLASVPALEVGVEPRLELVERLLAAIDDRLLAVADGLLEAGDPLVGVEFVL